METCASAGGPARQHGDAAPSCGSEPLPVRSTALWPAQCRCEADAGASSRAAATEAARPSVSSRGLGSPMDRQGIPSLPSREARARVKPGSRSLVHFWLHLRVVVGYLVLSGSSRVAGEPKEAHGEGASGGANSALPRRGARILMSVLTHIRILMLTLLYRDVALAY